MLSRGCTSRRNHRPFAADSERRSCAVRPWTLILLFQLDEWAQQPRRLASNFKNRINPFGAMNSNGNCSLSTICWIVRSLISFTQKSQELWWSATRLGNATFRLQGAIYLSQRGVT